MTRDRCSPDIMSSIDNDIRSIDNRSMDRSSDSPPEYKPSPKSIHGIKHWSSPSTSSSLERSSSEEIDEKVPITKNNNKPSGSQVLPKNVCPTICSVCGNAATGYHYDVPSCNGCKTFYRRTILDQRSFTCKKDEKCFEYGRREKKSNCRACRFRKCVDVGMNPLAIQMSSSQTPNMTVMSIINKRKSSECEPSTSSEVKIIPCSLSSFEETTESLIDQLLYLDIRTDQLRHGQFNPDPCDQITLRDIIKQKNSMSVAENMKPMENWPIPPRPPRIAGEEKKKREKERKFWLYHDLVGAVEYAKTFPCFNSLNDDDKVQLLKHVSLLCSNLTQAYYSYTRKSDIVLHPDGSMPGIINMDIKVNNEPVTSIFRAATAPLIRIHIDKKEYVLLKAILLCNAAVPELSDAGQAILTSERNRFAAALLSYCMASKGAVKGPAHFADVIGVVDTLQHQARNQKDMHILIRMSWQNPEKRFHGILGEVFDA